MSSIKKASNLFRWTGNRPTARKFPNLFITASTLYRGTGQIAFESRTKISIYRDEIVKLEREREGTETIKPSKDERWYYVGEGIK